MRQSDGVKCRLLIVEGLPCSGKSSVSAFAAAQLEKRGPVCFVDEGTGDHPADWEFHALREDGEVFPLASLPWEEAEKWMHRKIYDGLEWEEEKPVMLEKWRHFVSSARQDTVYVFNCVLLQNPMCETMMRFGFGEEVSRQYIGQIAEIIKPLQPAVIYLKNEDIASSVEKAAAERPGWLEGVVQYHVQGAYGKSVGAQGFEGYVACLRERQERELRILGTLPVDQLVVENPQRDWQLAHAKIASFLQRL